MITGKRINNLAKHFRMVSVDDDVTVGLLIREENRHKLPSIGFTDALEVGESVLPDSDTGPVSYYNAAGREIVHKDRPMETAYRAVEWHWEEWHGPYREDQSKIVDVPYKRYPRTFLPPPSMELSIAATVGGELYVVGPRYRYDSDHEDRLLHLVNLFLEIFGECELLSGELEPFLQSPLKRLNWTILPPGRRPWEQLQGEIAHIIDRAPEGNQPLIKHRLEKINGFGPEFTAIGNAGFRGYVVFGFPDSNLFIFESTFVGNATYVFGEDWVPLSKRTKAEILDEHLQRDRVIHRANWDQRINELLA